MINRSIRPHPRNLFSEVESSRRAIPGIEPATVLSAINGLAASGCSAFQALVNLKMPLHLRL